MCHRAAVTALLCVLWAGVAFGQDLTVTPSITIEERYDSNVRFNGKSENNRHDWISSASPLIRISRKRERYNLDASYRLDANYHSLNTDLNNFTHRATLDYGLNLTARTKINLGDTYDYTVDSLRATNTGILVTRTDITANTLSLGVVHAMTQNSDIGVTLKEATLGFDDPALLDTRTDSAELAYGYLFGPKEKVRFSYTFSNYHFNTDGSNVETHSLKAGIKDEVAPTMTVDVSGGTVFTRGTNGDDYYLLASAGIEKIYKDSALTLSYTREVTNPTGLTDQISISDRVNFIIAQTISRELTAEISGNVAKNRTEPSHNVDINSYNAAINGKWQPYRWMYLGTGISHYQQWSKDNLGTGLARNIVYLNVTFVGNEWRF
ncbi:MAG: outer membrane beta-barrel protein [Deltaproteobacteria bacterium]|nr:outer membrane beta-barrel protein [Deltaproteobacteria bacterium]